MIGKKLGQYEIVAEIGRGGMGTVYRARQISLDRDVALKVLAAHQALDPAALERFKREGAAVARIAHPNIVQILDVGEDQGLHFIAMEFVEGHTVSQILRQSGPFGYRDAVCICSQIASALGAVHKQDLIHRDIKASNILVKEDNTAKLADFGVASLSGASEGDRLTLTGAAVGTPYYMSPEQVKAREALTGASDVYSLGVVLYEMLTGAHPFGETSPTEAFSRVLNDSLPPVRRHRGDIPDDLERLLQRCVEKDKADRYPDGAALHEALEKVRLRLEMAEAAQGDAPDEYRKRVTGTGFFYVNEAQKSEAKLAVQMRGLLRELVAQVRDPNKRKRREVQRLYTQSLLARDEYKRGEKQLDELRKRQKHHADKAAQHKGETQKLIAAGKSEEAAASAEKESSCEKLALDYGLQADELGKQVQELRDEYDRRRESHAQAADELALLDAEARRAGKSIPAGGDNAGLAKRARALRYGLFALMAVLVVAAGGWAVSMWRAPKKASPEVAAVPPPPKQPVRPLPATSARKDGLVLHYTFDKDAGALVTDQSGMGNTGAVVNGAAWVADGLFGGAYRFDGINDFLRVPDRSSLRVQSMTMSAWVKADAFSGTEKQWVVLSKEKSGGAGGYYLAYDGRSATNNVAFNLMSGGLPVVGYHYTYSPMMLGTDRWYHLVGTFDGTKRTLYVDGIVKTSNAEPFTIYHDSQSLYIGAQANGAGGYWIGLIDDVRIYNRALSAAEVLQLYMQASPSAPAPGPVPKDGLVLHYTFDKDEGGKVTDQSGMGNTGTVHGATWTAAGGMGAAMSFDGVNDYVQALDSSSLRVQANTVAAWVKPDIAMGGLLNVIVAKEKYGGAAGYSLCHFSSTGIDYKLMVGGLSGQGYHDTIAPDTFQADRWSFLVGTFDGVTRRVYIDGQLKASIDEPLTITHDSKGLFVGGYVPGIPVYWNGLIDEVRIYNRALTAQEISQLYASTKP